MRRFEAISSARSTRRAELIASSNVNPVDKAFLSHPRVNLCKVIFGKEDMER